MYWYYLDYQNTKTLIEYQIAMNYLKNKGKITKK